MSDVSQGPGWWEASDGKWYPPKESDQAPAPGWWLAADGKWYPPVEAERAPGTGLVARRRRQVVPAGGPMPRDRPRPIDQSADAESPSPTPSPRPSRRPPDGRRLTARADSRPRPWTPAGRTPDAVARAPRPRRRRPRRPRRPRTGRPPRSRPAGRAPRRPRPAVAAVDRAPRTVAQAASDAMPVRRRSIDASDQIRTRDDASRQDAIALAPARFLAASPGPAGCWRPSWPTARRRPPARPAPAPAHRPTRRAARCPRRRRPPATPRHRLVAPSPAPPVAAALRPGREPLIELRTSPLGADIDHIGDRLLVFDDRVELRDRHRPGPPDPRRRRDHRRRDPAQVHRRGADRRERRRRAPS